MTKQNLLDLADRVEAGETIRDTEIIKALSLADDGAIALITAQVIVRHVFDDEDIPAGFAFIRHLDAAKALHDAVLPGWEWELGETTAVLTNWVKPSSGSVTAEGCCADNPAAAWVAAILRAKAGEQS